MTSILASIGNSLKRRFQQNADGSYTEEMSVGLPTAIADGRKVVAAAATAETLVATSTPCSAVIVQALSTNTDEVAIGGSTVIAASGATRRGLILTPGRSVPIAIDDAVKLFVDSKVNGEGVTFVLVSR